MASEEVKRLQVRIERAKNNADSTKLKNLYLELGGCLFREESYEEAMQSYEQAMSLCENKLWPSLEPHVHREIAETLLNIGEYERAVTYVNNYIELARKTRDPLEEQRGYATKGRIYTCWADVLVSEKSRDKKKVRELLQEGLSAFEKSLELCSLKDIDVRTKQNMKSRVLQNLGSVMALMGNYNESNSYFAAAILINKVQHFHSNLYWCYINQGEHFFRARECENAYTYFELARSVAGSSQKTIEASELKVKTLLKLGDIENAKVILRSIYRQQRGKDRDIVQQLRLVVFLCKNAKLIAATPQHDYAAKKALYEKQGDVFCALKEYTQGSQSYLKMLENSQLMGNSGVDLLPCYTSLAQTFRDDGQYESSLVYCKKELELLNEHSLEACKTYIFLGELYEYLEREYNLIHDTYRKSLNLALKIRNKELEILAVKRMSEVERRFGFLKQAEENERIWRRMDKNLKKLNDDHDEEEENNTEGFKVDVDDDELFSDDEEVGQREQNKRRCFKIKRNEMGETELHVAAIQGNYAKVKALLKDGHPVNETDSMGWTPLHEACNHGFPRIVELLIKYGADVNNPGGELCGGITPLHDAAENGHYAVVKVLLKNGACTSLLTDQGETPLDCLKHWRDRSDLSKDDQMKYEELSRMMKTNLDLLPLKEKRWNLVRDLRREKDIDAVGEEPEDGSDEVEAVRGRTVGNPWQSSGGNAAGKTEQPKASSSRSQSATEIYKSAIRGVGRRVPPPSSKRERKLAPLISEAEVKKSWLDDEEEGSCPDEEEDEEENRRVLSQPSSKRRKISKEEPARKSNVRKKEEVGHVSRVDEVTTKKAPLVVSTQQETMPEASQPVKGPKAEGGEEKEKSSGASVGEYVKFKIPILDVTLLVPILKSEIEKLTVQSLANAAAERYAQIHGRKPNLLLMTKDSAIPSGKDPLCVLLDEEIKSRVLTWADVGLREKYEKECERVCALQPLYSFPLVDVQALPFVVDALNAFAANSDDFVLRDRPLKPQDLVPAFQVIKNHCQRIMMLDLSRNGLGDEVIEVIVNFLREASCRGLKLAANNLTARGIQMLAKGLDHVPKQNLDEIHWVDLSFNPLTNEVVDHISVLRERLKNLEYIGLRRCGVTVPVKQLTDKSRADEDSESEFVVELNESAAGGPASPVLLDQDTAR